jgi:hypothetical protein
VATNGGQPLIGATLTMGSQTATTDSGGHFRFAFPTTGAAVTSSIIGPGLLDRHLFIRDGDRDVTVDAISLSGGFDLDYYRRIIRNGYEAPTHLEPLRRWTKTPMIYLKTVDEAGAQVLPGFLDQVEAIVTEGVTRWTGGVLGVPTVARGTDTREGVSGWITIKFPATSLNQADGTCGYAQVGQDGGFIELGYHEPDTASGGCRVPGFIVAPRTIRHELGHALGLWHTGYANEVMSGLQWDYSQANEYPTPRELAAIAIAYNRPVGNTDPDTDPSTAVMSLPSRAVR